MRAVLFEEVYGLKAGAVEAARASLEARFKAAPPTRDGLVRSGVSPHAPYSVSPELFRAAQAIASVRPTAL